MTALLFFAGDFFVNVIGLLIRWVQAARSGKQNIIEGSMASGTSTETEIKLTNVARASLEELLEDYHDYLRTGEFQLWNKNNKEATYVRKLSAGKILPPKSNSGTGGTGVTIGAFSRHALLTFVLILQFV